MNLKSFFVHFPVVCFLSLAGCSPDEVAGENNPAIAFTEHEITVPATGDEVSIGYIIQNPEENAEIKVKSDRTWIVS